MYFMKVNHSLHIPSPIQTFTVGSGVAPDPPLGFIKTARVADLEVIYFITAGWEFHPPRRNNAYLIFNDPWIIIYDVFITSKRYLFFLIFFW